ncbi:hypothetical protein ACFLQ2_02860 [archaeon]
MTPASAGAESGMDRLRMNIASNFVMRCKETALWQVLSVKLTCIVVVEEM